VLHRVRKGCAILAGDIDVEHDIANGPHPPTRMLDVVLDRRAVSLPRVAPVVLGDERLVGAVADGDRRPSRRIDSNGLDGATRT
jgi:hypothetical protein